MGWGWGKEERVGKEGLPCTDKFWEEIDATGIILNLTNLFTACCINKHNLSLTGTYV